METKLYALCIFNELCFNKDGAGKVNNMGMGEEVIRVMVDMAIRKVTSKKDMVLKLYKINNNNTFTFIRSCLTIKFNLIRRRWTRS